jgi:hypothetical protein
MGRPGTEEFVPGFLHLSLSRDKGTAGQPKLFCPGTKGQRDRETFLSRDVPSLGNPNLNQPFSRTSRSKNAVVQR